MVPRAQQAADILAAQWGVEATVIDLRSLVPLDVGSVVREVRKTRRMFTVEENPRLCGWGAELASVVTEDCFEELVQPVIRITTPHLPLPAADALEDELIPSVGRIVTEVAARLGARRLS